MIWSMPIASSRAVPMVCNNIDVYDAAILGVRASTSKKRERVRVG